jgi:DNA-binding transcriptional ArsR family regulator
LIFAGGYGEKNVSQLIAATGLSQANVSGHVRIPTDSGIFARRKQGAFVFYSTSDSSVFSRAKFETNQSGNLSGFSCLNARAAVSKIGSPRAWIFCTAIFTDATGGEAPNL